MDTFAVTGVTLKLSHGSKSLAFGDELQYVLQDRAHVHLEFDCREQ